MKKIFRVLAAIFLLLVVVIAPAGKAEAQPRFRYRYVVPGGSLTSTYCTAQDPCDLRHAIDNVAVDGDVIVVHSGIYNSNLPATELIVIEKTLTLWGSCEFDASTPFHCFPDERNSILDVEGAKRVIRIEGATGNEEVTIEGFTIRNGSGVFPAPCFGTFSHCGGGINATNLAELSLKNNNLWDNLAGSSSGLGGGLFADDIDFLEVEHNTFFANQATEIGQGFGGGALVMNSGGPRAVVFTNNIFHNNSASTEFYTDSAGAGLLVFNSNNVQIVNNEFELQNNSYKIDGMNGTSLFLEVITGFNIEGNSFTGDWGSSVVAVSGNTETEGTMARNKWWNNLVLTNLSLQGPIRVDVTNNFLGRQTISPLSRGGASTNIFIGGGTGATDTNNIKVLFNTLAAADFGIQIGPYSDVDILSNIFTGLNESIAVSPTSVAMNIYYNLFYGNTSNDYVGINAIYANPKLADISSGDFHLLPGSGAIDKSPGGDFNIDIDGQSRPIGSGPTPFDIGADEFRYTNFLPFISK